MQSVRHILDRKKRKQQQDEYQKRQYEELEEYRRRDEESRRAEQRRVERERYEQEGYEQAERLRRQQELEQTQREESEMLRLQHEMREAERQNRLRRTTPEAIRRVRNLIRTRYQLDIYIWGLRDVRQSDKKIVMAHCEKADAVLDEIEAIVGTWKENEWQPEEWRIAKKIQDQLAASDTRRWTSNPPWNRNYPEASSVVHTLNPMMPHEI